MYVLYANSCFKFNNDKWKEGKDQERTDTDNCELYKMSMPFQVESDS